ncbi:MAG: hypothetical protein ACRD0Z_11615 [Acidimicrobiales bacterium]
MTSAGIARWQDADAPTRVSASGWLGWLAEGFERLAVGPKDGGPRQHHHNYHHHDDEQ